MDTSDLNVFSLSHSYKLQGFVQLQIIKLGKIKYTPFRRSDLDVCRIAARRFNINVPLAARVVSAARQAGLCSAGCCVCNT